MATMVAGSNAPLTAENPGLGGVMVAMGWQIVPSNGPQSELTSMAIICGEDGRALSPEHLVFFNQLTTAGGGVRFTGGEGAHGPGTFGAVRSAYIRLARPDGSELLRFDVPEMHGDRIKAMMFGELYRHRDDWKFRALGQGYENGLAGVSRDFGLDL
jgi:tellurium resistance protein TerD